MNKCPHCGAEAEPILLLTRVLTCFERYKLSLEKDGVTVERKCRDDIPADHIDDNAEQNHRYVCSSCAHDLLEHDVIAMLKKG